MPDRNELLRELVGLPEEEYSALLSQADDQRREVVAHLGKDAIAHWIARCHLEIDGGLTKILYLPVAAPANEIRLLEVNEQAGIPVDAPVEAVDFMPDIAGVEYALHVADVTPRQFDKVMAKELALPEGWSLEGAQPIERNSR